MNAMNETIEIEPPQHFVDYFTVKREFDTFCNLGTEMIQLFPQVTMNVPFIYCSNQCICIKKHNFVEPRFYYMITSVLLYHFFDK